MSIYQAQKLKNELKDNFFGTPCRFNLRVTPVNILQKSRTNAWDQVSGTNVFFYNRLATCYTAIIEGQLLVVLKMKNVKKISHL